MIFFLIILGKLERLLDNQKWPVYVAVTAVVLILLRILNNYSIHIESFFEIEFFFYWKISKKKPIKKLLSIRI